MKILFLTNHLNSGGITSYVLSLGKGLKEIGHEVKIASRGGEKLNLLKTLGIEHFFLNLFTKSEISPKVFRAKRELLSILKQEKFDLLHAQTRLTRVIAQYVQNKLAIPFISTAHGFYKKRFAHRIFPCWGEGIIAVSKAVEKHLKDNLGLSGMRIKVIYNGIETIDLKKYRQEAGVLKNKLGLKEGPVIGIVSRLSEIKGHLYLIRAMRYILEKIPSAQLIIIGEGRMKKALLKLIQDLNMGRNVFLIPSLSDKYLMFSLIDVFVLPSLEEGLGLVILEAMAGGIPVVASEVGGIPEIIKNGENGLLVLPRDEKGLAEAIIKILENSTFRDRIVINAKHTIESKFSLRDMVKKTEEFYREIVAN